MKKKVILGKKLFLKKEAIAELTLDEQSNLLGGAGSSQCPFVQTSGCGGTELPDNPGGAPTVGASLCGTVVWRTFNAQTVCK